MEIIVHGAAGHMGRIVAEKGEAGFAGVTGVIRVDAYGKPEECYTSLSDYTGSADVVVDFSHHTAVNALLDYCQARKLPVVIATTGHTPEEVARIHAAAEQIPVFFAANMSLGIAVLADLATRAAAAFPGADIEIVEKHHNRKLDVPSGTALLLARKLTSVRENAKFVIGRHENGRRQPEEIGIHSLRLGNEVGTHEIIIATGSETLTLRHEAENRALFADGALKAAAFMHGKAAGLYTMEDLIGGLA